jgi:hypothetical protein
MDPVARRLVDAGEMNGARDYYGQALDCWPEFLHALKRLNNIEVPK